MTLPETQSTTPIQPQTRVQPPDYATLEGPNQAYGSSPDPGWYAPNEYLRYGAPG